MFNFVLAVTQASQWPRVLRTGEHQRFLQGTRMLTHSAQPAQIEFVGTLLKGKDIN